MGEARNAAILLTPAPGAQGAAIAVLRIRGPLVPDFLRKSLSKPASPRKCVHAQLRDGQEIIDDPIVVLSESAQWADLCLHGGPWIVASALALCQREGFAILDSTTPLPPEALDDAADDLEREMLAHLPQALTLPAVRMLLNQPAAWRQALKSPIDPAPILKDQTLWRLLHPPQIAITGEPNVGKSTLANRLFGTQRSITADIPGTTRDWVAELADIAGMPAFLVDTPGLRQTEDPIERAAISASRPKITQSDLLIVVLDAAHPPQHELPIRHEVPSITVVNKIDRPPAWNFQSTSAIAISAQTGEGIESLIRAIHNQMGISNWNEHRPRWWTPRQKTFLAEALANPQAALKICSPDQWKL